MTEPTVPLERLAKIYMKIRTAIQEINKEYEGKIEELKAQQELVANAMKDQMMAQGMKTARTNNGTIILGQKQRFFTQDWDAFKTFVVEHDALDLFEKRIHQSNMQQFLEANPALVPPGLNAETEYTVSVRKPTAN
jgi:hypothetical protein